MTRRTASFGRKLALATLAALVLVIPAAAADLPLRVVSQTNSTITLGWTPVSGYGYLFSVNGKVVSRTNDASRNNVKFAKVANATYEVAALVKGDIGKHPVVTPPPPGDTTPPSAPSSIAITSTSQTSVTVGWGAATDNVAVTNYRIYRDTTLIGQGPGSSGGFANTWVDTSRTCNESHEYGVEAQDAAGNTSPKVTVIGATAPCSDPPPPPPGGTTISVSQFNALAVSGAVIDGYTVTGGVDITRTNVTVRNSTIQGTIKWTPQASGGKLINSRARGFYVFGADDILIEGSQLDAGGTANLNIIWDEPAGNTPDRFIFRNSSISNVYSSDPNSHNEAIYIGYSTGGLIENSTFTNNGNTAHLFFTSFGNQFNSTSYPRNWCVRGNTFGPTHGAFFDVNFGGNVPQVGPSVATIRIDPDNVLPHGLANNWPKTDC